MEMMGDRLAAIIVSMLIVVTSMQSDLGLGRLSYLIWVDNFNVVSLIMLSIALLESIMVHYLLRKNMDVAVGRLHIASAPPSQYAPRTQHRAALRARRASARTRRSSWTRCSAWSSRWACTSS